MVKTSPMQIRRLKDRRPSVVDPMVAAARQYTGVWASSPDAWSLDTVNAPDVTDMSTIITFAQMAANAYIEKPNTGEWVDPGGNFNRTDDNGFGWEGNNLRGYLYANKKNSTIVIGLKGTTLAIWDGDGTTTNDKENDNLFFSCCCGQQGGTFARQVCDCATGTYTCDVKCLKTALQKENRYYSAARHLYNNVTAMYPDAEVWLSGHSLGGSLSAMIGLTYGVPALTFEAVPDALPANRLGLPVPPGVDPDRPGQRENIGAYHFGHNADPIYMGTCNGATASCSYAGYALETSCHSGRECMFDVVKDNSTRVSVMTHKIAFLIGSVLKKYTKVPECKFASECYDCPLWKEVEGHKSESTTATTTSTRSKTRTETCKTPGWWGCLDETTTSSGTVTSTSTTTTSSTSTCKTPGWFGCLDKTTTTLQHTTTQPHTPTKTHTSSTTCETPGWWGCADPTSTTHAKPSTTKTSSTAEECKTPGFFWGCDDEPTSTKKHHHSITSPPALPSSTLATVTKTKTKDEEECTSSVFFGLICVDPSPVPSASATGKPRKDKKCMERSWWFWCAKWEGEESGMRLEV